MIAASAKQIDGAELLTKEFNPELEENCNATWITQNSNCWEKRRFPVDTSKRSSCVAVPQLLAH